jgi:hypothetical protein
MLASVPRLSLLVVSALVSACATSSQSACNLTPERREVVKANIAAAIQGLSNEMTFNLDNAFTSEGNLRPVRGQIEGVRGVCWVFALAESRDPRYDILHGESAFVVDPLTLKVTGPEWITF